MSIDQSVESVQSVVPNVAQSAARGVTSQNNIVDQLWRELESAKFRLEEQYIDRLVWLYHLDQATIKRLIFLRYRLMSGQD